MLDGVIILDSENNIVNFNNSSKIIIPELTDIEPGDKKIDEVLKGYAEILKCVNHTYYNESLISIKSNEQLRYYKMNINSYSYGIASFPREGMEFKQLIKVADERMYEYKRMVKSITKYR